MATPLHGLEAHLCIRFSSALRGDLQQVFGQMALYRRLAHAPFAMLALVTLLPSRFHRSRTPKIK